MQTLRSLHFQILPDVVNHSCISLCGILHKQDAHSDSVNTAEEDVEEDTAEENVEEDTAEQDVEEHSAEQDIWAFFSLRWICFFCLFHVLNADEQHIFLRFFFGR